MAPKADMTQSEIDAVWRGVWKEGPPDAAKGLFRNRLFIEAYPAFSRYFPPNPARVLDVGCGTGRYGVRLAQQYPSAVVYLADIVEESLAFAHSVADAHSVKNVRFAREDMTALSFKDNSFDFVFSDGVVHLLPNPEQGMRELVRVLAPGGVLIVSVVNLWNFHALQKWVRRVLGLPPEYFGYERSHTRKQLAELARSAGGTVKAIDGYYVAYGIFRMGSIFRPFGMIGRALNRCVKWADRFSNRYFSKHFGFGIFCVVTKKLA
jgi:SAM-dependent methyltransferase